jgi:hypothetical protein
LQRTIHDNHKEKTMLNQNPAEPQPKSTTSAAKPANDLLDPHSPIETASTGNGTTTDPSGTDRQPPSGYSDGGFLPEA